MLHFLKEILNSKGDPNCMAGSRVMSILLNGWMLPIGEASAVEGLCSTGIPRLVFKESAPRLILSSSRNVHVYIYLSIRPLPMHFLGLSLALRSHNLFQASHWSTFFPPSPQKNILKKQLKAPSTAAAAQKMISATIRISQEILFLPYTGYRKLMIYRKTVVHNAFFHRRLPWHSMKVFDLALSIVFLFSRKSSFAFYGYVFVCFRDRVDDWCAEEIFQMFQVKCDLIWS